MIKKITKHYIYINITMLFLDIYVMIYPFISKLIEKINPNLTKCVYLQLTGHPCPLCGGTRFLSNIYKVFFDYKYILNFFGIVFMFLIFDIIFRIVNMIKIKNKRVMDKTIIFDIIIHIIAYVLFITYGIIFILYN